MSSYVIYVNMFSFMIQKCLIGRETETTDVTLVEESVWEMFRFNVVSQVPGHVARVFTNPTSLVLPILRCYELVKIFQALELSLNKNNQNIR